MIHPNDLRLGNFVINHQGKVCTVDGFKRGDAGHDYRHIVTFKEIGAISAYGYQICSIPLTPEILEKCGFEKDEEGRLYKKVPYGVDYRVYLLNDFIQLTRGMTTPIHNLKHINALHLLQNWWYFTYNEELTVNI